MVGLGILNLATEIENLTFSHPNATARMNAEWKGSDKMRDIRVADLSSWMNNHVPKFGHQQVAFHKIVVNWKYDVDCSNWVCKIYIFCCRMFAKKRAQRIKNLREQDAKTDLFFHCIWLTVLSLWSTMYSPKSCPLGENAFVQGHTDGVHLTDWTIEMCLEISMRPEGFAYMARSAVFCMELDGLEIVYIIWKKSILDAVL